MSDTIDGFIDLKKGFNNLGAMVPSIVNTDSVIQNRGLVPICVHYRSAAGQPSGGGIKLEPDGIWGGNAANIWIEVLGDSCQITVALS